MLLPQDVGDALLACLEQIRPTSREERVFLRIQAPFRPFAGASEIAGIVARVLSRGSIDDIPTGAHVFRHSLATAMLRSGANLEAVGTVLRHRSQNATAIGRRCDARYRRAALAGGHVMLSSHVARYVAFYRGLGLRFNEQKRVLELYAACAEAHGDRYTRVRRIEEWCATAFSPPRARARFDIVRRFCGFLNAEDPEHEVPPAQAFGRDKVPRPGPHILKEAHIRAVLRAALD